MIRHRKKSEREPTIALINIVFLMLIFFLVAGTIAQPLEKDLKLVSTKDLNGVAPANAVVILPDGQMMVAGKAVEDVQATVETLRDDAGAVRIVPDRNLPAKILVKLGAELRGAGAEKVLIVTERAME
ncbi:MAG: biopolymer transporter ExbD [Pelagimonas sp.]|jgi:biopolymer transport protein ExbD|nr:biopolymer transporter ExbD [Pelagimonas sp.]